MNAPGNFHSQPVDVEKETRSRRVKTAVLAFVSAGVLVGGAAMAWYLTPPALPESEEQALRVMKSARFARLSADAKEPYYDIIREKWGMNPDFRRQWFEDEDLRDAGREMFMQMMNERLDAYMLAGFEERKDMMPPMMGPPPGMGNGPPLNMPNQGQMRERMSERLSNGNSQRGAAMGEMIRSMPMPGAGGGGPPRSGK